MVHFATPGELRSVSLQADSAVHAIAIVKEADGIADADILRVESAPTEPSIECPCGSFLLLPDQANPLRAEAKKIRARVAKLATQLDARLAEIPPEPVPEGENAWPDSDPSSRV